MATIQKIATVKVWPFASFQSSESHPAAVVQVLYKDGGDTTYTALYLLAEPGIVHMIAFDVDVLVADEFERERTSAEFDAIVKSVTWSDVALTENSENCR